jgi:tRNA(Ile2)-agmatinylcytidine synthase
MGWLGLDDTDSLEGGCTTEVFHRLLLDLPNEVEIGVPRLVRLWPFAQRRTRGNAALAVEVHTDDEAGLLEHLDGWWTTHLLPLVGGVQASTMSDREQSPASPGMVWFSEQPHEAYYWAAVQGDATDVTRPTPVRSWGGHGCIGATAAVAWSETRVTWEAVAWRMEHTEVHRKVDERCLLELDAWPDVVFSRDPRRGKQLIAPRGRSPVLFGVRALTFEAAERACLALVGAEGTETVDAWRVFATNQASGDHLQGSSLVEVASVETDAVRKHAVLTAPDGLVVRAFAEGGPVNALARWLLPGDTVEVRGLRHPDGSLHAEQMRLVSSVPRRRRRPLCQDCRLRMKSMGEGQGVRCPGCKRRDDDRWENEPAEPPHLGWVEPQVDARRHLARPLSWEERPSRPMS